MTHLSPREMDVARLVAEELADKTIASQLGISVHTVDTYLRRISVKIGVAKVARRRAIRRWLIDHTA